MRVSIRPRRAALLALAAAPFMLVRAAEAPRISPEKIRGIEQIISSEMARSTIPGVNAAIGLGWGMVSSAAGSKTSRIHR